MVKVWGLGWARGREQGPLDEEGTWEHAPLAQHQQQRQQPWVLRQMWYGGLGLSWLLFAREHACSREKCWAEEEEPEEALAK